MRKCKFLEMDLDDNEYYCRSKKKCSKKNPKSCPALCFTHLLFPLKEMVGNG